MKLVRYNRPKLPRNKYGIESKNGFFSGGIVAEDGSLDIKYDDGYNTSTQLSESPTVVSESEWYNIQTKIVYSYKTRRDSNGNIIYENRVDSGGNVMHDANGEIMTVPAKDLLGDTWVTVIENYNNNVGLKNPDLYRFVLLRFRKHKREGKRWRIPWFSPKYQKVGDGVQLTKMDILEEDCWWTVQGAETKWWNKSRVFVKDEIQSDGTVTHIYRNKTYKDILPVGVDHTKYKYKNAYMSSTVDINGSPLNYVYKQKVQIPLFKNTGTRTMVVGCALFKNTGTGAFGWQRVSNIATVRLCLDSSGSIRLEANK